MVNNNKILRCELWLERAARICLLFVLFLVSTNCGLQRRRHPITLAEISHAEAVATSWSQVAPERWSLSNGLTVLFLEDRELPLVSGTLYIKSGSLWEPADAGGLVSAMGTLMRQGGAGNFSADQLDRELEILSASISSNFGAELGTIGFSCLDLDFERVFSMFAAVVLEPRFELPRLELWRDRMREEIKRRIEQPEVVAGLALRRLLYGDSAYGRVVVTSDLRKISRGRLLQAHRRFVRPNEAILAVSGRISKDKLQAVVAEKLGAWKKAVDKWPPPPRNDFVPQAGIYFIKQPLEQATVFIGQLGVPRLTPDYLAIDVFNEIFGTGGFGSHLVRNVRTRAGLAYGVYGGIFPALVRGKNLIVLQTKASSVAKGIEEALRVLINLQQSEVSAGELVETKRVIENSYVFNFDAPGKIVNRAAQLELLGYPADYDHTYLPGIRAVSAAQVQEVAKQRWHLEELILVVVGPESAYVELEQMMTQMPELLPGMLVRRVNFGEKLLL